MAKRKLSMAEKQAAVDKFHKLLTPRQREAVLEIAIEQAAGDGWAIANGYSTKYVNGITSSFRNYGDGLKWVQSAAQNIFLRAAQSANFEKRPQDVEAANWGAERAKRLRDLRRVRGEIVNRPEDYAVVRAMMESERDRTDKEATA